MAAEMSKDSVTGTLVFVLGKLGQMATDGFADKLRPLGLRPRHCAVLELLQTGAMAQLELAQALGVTPSVVVDMVDELEALGAVARARDATDRRRQLVELTAEGRQLARRAARLAHQVDAEFLAPLNASQAAALREALVGVASTRGLPVS
jgi:DNA-binding MarR family transcriptional regulator